MLSKEYNGSMCEVTSMDNKLIVTGFIRMTDEGVEIYNNGDRMPVLKFGSQVKLSLHNPQLGMQVMAGEVYLSDPTFLRLVKLQVFAEYEKRRFFRLTIDHSADLIPTGKDGAQRRGGKIPVRVKDVSLCGLQFECEEPLALGGHYRIRIALQDNLLETLDFVIRRVLPRDKNKNRYGGEFLELTAHAEQRLCSFIFSQQQKQIRRSRS